MLLQEDIEIIKRIGMKTELYSEILKHLKIAVDNIEEARSNNTRFETSICVAEEALKIAKQLYQEWVKVNEQHTDNL